jgi:hypothetical protein
MNSAAARHVTIIVAGFRPQGESRQQYVRDTTVPKAKAAWYNQIKRSSTALAAG